MKRTTRMHTRSRRSHHALRTMNLSACPKCAKPTRPHTACPNCGTYKGRQVLQIKTSLDKKKRVKEQAPAKTMAEKTATATA
ncbi:MAG: 50S ribosomal protein L32 [Patescibacteria group bacterium]